MIPWLRGHPVTFPPSEQALEAPNGLLAAGGDLSVGTLLSAYQQGIFPWYNEGDPILWWSPNPRMVFFPDELHIGRRLRRTLSQHPFTVTLNHDFSAVIRGCAEPREDHEGTWLTQEMQAAYIELHRQGHAHSIEVWHNQELVGGVYGVKIHQAFFAESMFRRVTDASKIGLIHLVHHLGRSGCQIIDCQQHSLHLERLGAKLIGRTEFNRILEKACITQPTSPNWKPGSAELKISWKDFG